MYPRFFVGKYLARQKREYQQFPFPRPVASQEPRALVQLPDGWPRDQVHFGQHTWPPRRRRLLAAVDLCLRVSHESNLSLLLPFASFALLAGLVALEPTTAKVTTGTLEGTVLDSHGKALSGATVTIQTSDGRHPHATRTDARGHFEFLRFEVGQYDVRAYINGSYSDWAKRVVIRSMKPNSITLRIPTVEVLTAPNHNWLYLKHLPETVDAEVLVSRVPPRMYRMPHRGARGQIGSSLHGLVAANAGTTVPRKGADARFRPVQALLLTSPTRPPSAGRACE